MKIQVMKSRSLNMNHGMIKIKKNLKYNKKRENKILNMKWYKSFKSQYNTKKSLRKD